MPKKKTRKKKAKESASGVGNDIKEAMKEKKLLIGSNSVIRAMKKGGLQVVICASNLPAERKKELEKHASALDIVIKDFGNNSANLGEACGKPFNILLIGIKK